MSKSLIDAIKMIVCVGVGRTIIQPNVMFLFTYLKRHNLAVDILCRRHFDLWQPHLFDPSYHHFQYY